MRIVFVHTPMATMPVPEFREFWQNFDIRYHASHPRLRHMRNIMWELPHWMHWLAGVLVTHGYDDLRVVDFYSRSECALTGIDTVAVENALRANEADVYLFSPMTPNLPFALQIADVVKALYPKSVTVFGGVVATPLREEMAAHPSVDYVVANRGEYALPALLDAIAVGGDVTAIGNLSWKDPTGSVVSNDYVYPWMSVGDLPFPKVDLFTPDVGQDLRYIRQVYALGCPFQCSFCTILTIGRKADYFSVDRVIEEIRAYRGRYGEHHGVYFGDETFTVHRGRTLEICDALRDEGNLTWDCQTRLNCLRDDSVLNAIREAGCRWIEIGVETINQESQDLFKQRTKISELTDTLKRVRAQGLATCAFIVHGLPNQTLDDMKRSLHHVCEMIQGELIEAIYLNGFVPYPGTDFYDDPDRYGMRIRHHEFEHYHEDGPPVFDTNYASSDEIYRVFREGVLDVAQAMRAATSLSPRPPQQELVKYGAFWGGSHS